MSDVLQSLEGVIHTQIKVSLDDGIEPFSDFDQASDEFWEQSRDSRPRGRVD